MDTIAIWYEKKNDSDNEPIHADLHFNVWEIPQKGSKRTSRLWTQKTKLYLDIGLKISQIDPIKAIKISIPCKLSNNDIFDLGERLIEHPELIRSIFNEDYHVILDNHPKLITVKKMFTSVGDTSDPTMVINALEFESDYSLKQIDKEERSVLTIKCDNLNCKDYFYRNRVLEDSSEPENQPVVYFRLRVKIPVKKKGSFMQSFSRYFSLQLDGSRTLTKTIDFRYNEKRNYSRRLLGEILSANEFYVDKVHFLLMQRSTVDVISHGKSYTCRRLEHKIWHTYIKDLDGEDYLAYHWKKSEDKGSDPEKKGISSFNVLVKTKEKSVLLKLFLLYLFLILAISFVTECTSTVISRPIIKKVSLFLHNSLEVTNSKIMDEIDKLNTKK